MRSAVRILTFGCVALVAPIVLLRMCSLPAQRAQLESQSRAYAGLLAEAERRNHFLDGFQAVRGTTMGIDHYYHEHWSLPPSIEAVRHGLPRPGASGPTGYAFDPQDGAVTMFFEGRAGIVDGEVSFVPAIDETNRRLDWTCWTEDYPEIEAMLPGCEYVAP